MTEALPRSAGTQEQMTPRRTVAVGLLTLVAVVVTFYAAAAIFVTGNGQSSYGHPFWHLLWGVLTVPIAVGILFVRRAWPATGWTERSLVAAVVFALTSAAGNVLAGIGVLPEYEASSLYGHPLWQFSWAGPTVAIALGILLVRRAWPATVLARRWLAVALAFALAFAAGNVLIGIGVLPYYPPPTNWPTTTFSLSFHNVGEFLAVGPFAILVLLCLVMVGVGVRGALRPTAHAS